MKPYPHHYSVEARATGSGDVELRSGDLPTIATAAPIEFDGPGGRWSPESLLVAAVADCFALTFRAVARASRLEWSVLRCRAEGTLNRMENVTRFVAMGIDAELTLPQGGNADAARRILEKSERSCLVARSIDLPVELRPIVTIAGQG